MNIAGHKQVTYSELQKLMEEKYNAYKVNNNEIHLAVAINVKSPQTVRNAFQQNMQVVSDEVLTSVTDAIGLPACIVWEKGQKNYFVKGK